MSSVYEKSKGNYQSSVLDIQDTLYQAAAVAARSEIQKTAIDITKECVVTDNSKWEDGEYEVRSGTTPFKAYSNDSNHYLVNETVYVTIPKGDASLQKFIIGRKIDTDDENILYNYQFPFDDFVALKQLIKPLSEQHGFLANKNVLLDNSSGMTDYDIIQSKFLSLAENASGHPDLSQMTSDSNFSVDDEILIAEWHNSSDTPGPTIGDRLGIKMNVQTLLDSQRPMSGTYGVRIHIKGLLKTGATEDERDCYFRSTDMYGNPYSYIMQKEQQMIFDVSEFLRITDVQVYFIQDFMFFNQYNEYIKWKYGETCLPANIILSQIGVYLGFAASELGKDQLFLYTYDSQVYGDDPDSTLERVNLDTKTVYLAYVHYNQDSGTYELYDSQEEFDEAGVEIFWYIRDPSWVLDASNPAWDSAKNEHKYSGIFWAPMSGEDSELPKRISMPEERIYDKSTYTFVPDINKSVYKLRAAVRYNNGHTLSDILEFTNRKDVEGDTQDLARNNKVILRISTVLYDNQDPTKAEHSTVYSSDDFSNFFLYDENNNILVSDDSRTFEQDGITYVFPNGKRYSDITWFADIWIREDVFKNVNSEQTPPSIDGYVRLADFCYDYDRNEQGLPIAQYVPFEVEWGTLQHPTMIQKFSPVPQSTFNSVPYWNARSAEQISCTGLAFSGEYPTKQDIDKLTTRQFNISSMYDINANHNTLTATIRRNGQEFTAKKELLFGRAMAQGCAYTPVIDIEQPLGADYIEEETPFILRCSVIDRFGKTYTSGFTCAWEFFGNKPSGEPGVPTGSPYFATYQDHATDPAWYTGVLHGTQDHQPFSVKCIIRGIGEADGGLPIDYDIYATRGMLVTDDGDWLAAHSVLSVSRVEFDAAGQAPHYASGKFEVIRNPRPMTETEETALTAFATCLKEYLNKLPNGISQTDYLTTNLTDTVRSITLAYMGWGSLNNANLLQLRQALEGEMSYPTWHLHNPASLDRVIHLYNKPKYESKRLLVQQEDTYDNTLNYQYYDAQTDTFIRADYNDPDNTRDFNADKNSKLLFYYKTIEAATFYNGTSEAAPNVSEFYLRYGATKEGDTDDYNTYWQWKDELGTDAYFTWLSFAQKKEDNTTVHVSQGIAFQRYVYASSLVNEWDGTSLTLDEENGAVLATMIAAGTKNAKNQFTGVMLGNWASKADSSMDQAGLYGFQNGAMSFGFTEDGTGFIGPSGAGRIQFDGRNAMISNSTKTCYINLNPVTLTYYDTERHWYDASDAGKSQYFLYCKVPVNPDDLKVPYAEKVKMRWADEFMNDEANNYFIVDPNQGALITGGIASKYGRIGNWYINDNGLYQIYEDKTNPKNSRFMYLGMPSLEKVDINLDDRLAELEPNYAAYITRQRNYTLYYRLAQYLADSSLSAEELRSKIESAFEDNPNYTYNVGLDAQTNAERTMTNISNLYVGGVPYPAGAVFENGHLNLHEGYQETFYIEQYLKELEDGASSDIGTWEPGAIEQMFRNLSKYFDQSLFSMDVYHWYGFGMAAHNVAAYLQRALDELATYDEAHQTAEQLFALIYDAAKLMAQDYNPNNPNDWSVDGPYSLRNLETHLHNHYSTAGTSTTYRYEDKIGNYVTVSIPSRAKYRTTANYGYQTNLLQLIPGASYAVNNYAVRWDPEIDPEGNGSVIYKDSTYVTPEEYIYGNNPLEKYYDESLQDYAWRPASEYAAYIRITPIGEVAPRYIPGTTVTVSFSASAGSTSNWSKNSSVPLTAVALKSLDGYLTVSGEKMTLRNTGLAYSLNAVDPVWLTGYIQALNLIYEYYRKCFCYQIADMLESGLRKLETTNHDEWLVVTEIINGIGGIDVIRNGDVDITGTAAVSGNDNLNIDDTAIYNRAQLLREQAAEERLNEIRERIQKLRQQMMRELFENSDANKFAIYAGYQSPFNGGTLAPNPFFSVRWNGYMTARHGKLGVDSPWYIGDAGLTQTNNFGTIFLGSPDQDGQISEESNLLNPNKATWMDEFGHPIGVREDGGSTNAYLLPNGGKIKIPPGLTTDDGATIDLEVPEIKIIKMYTTISKSRNKDEYGNTPVVPSHRGKYVWVRFYEGKYRLYLGHHWDPEIYDSQTNTYTQNGAVVIYEVPIDELGFGVQSTYFGPNAFGERGCFAIYAGKADAIHFGVRLDGTLFTDRGNIGTWLLDQNKLGTYSTYIVDGNPEIRPKIELDATGKITIDNGNILLDGTNPNYTSITLGTLSQNAKVQINGFSLASESSSLLSHTLAQMGIAPENRTYGVPFEWHDMRDSTTANTTYEVIDADGAGTTFSSGSDAAAAAAQERIDYLRNTLIPEQEVIIEECNNTISSWGKTSGTQYWVDYGIVNGDGQWIDDPSNPGNMIWQPGASDPIYYLYEDPLPYSSGTYYYLLGTETDSKYGTVYTIEDLKNHAGGTGSNYIISSSYLRPSSSHIMIAGLKGLTAATQVTQALVTATKNQKTAAENQLATYQAELQTLLNNQAANLYSGAAYPIDQQKWNYSFRVRDDVGTHAVELYGDKLSITAKFDASSPAAGMSILSGYATAEEGISNENTVFVHPEYVDNEGNTIPALYIDKTNGTYVIVKSISNQHDGYLENWNLKGTYVNSNNIYGNAIYQGGKIVATQEWAIKFIYDVLDAKVVTVNNTACAAYKRANEAAAAAQAAADAAAEANGKAIIDVKGGENGPYGGVTGIKLHATRANGETIDSLVPYPVVASKSHGHTVTLTATSGSIKAVTSGPRADTAVGEAVPIFSTSGYSQTLSSGSISTSITIAGATSTPSDISIYSGGSSTVTCDADGNLSFDITVAGETQSYTGSIASALEKSFKAGWNAAIAAISVSSDPAAISTNGATGSWTVSVAGGEGKDSYNKTLTATLSYTAETVTIPETEYSNVVDGHTNYGNATMFTRSGTDPDYTYTSRGYHYWRKDGTTITGPLVLKSGITSTASSVSVSFGSSSTTSE